MSQIQIQIHFTCRGDWSVYTLTALYEDATGWASRDTYRPDALPDAARACVGGIIGRLRGMAAPWRAVHVAASYQPYEPASEAVVDEEAGEVLEPARDERPEAVMLTVRARRDSDNAARTLTHAQLPELMLTDAAVIAVFKSLTHMD